MRQMIFCQVATLNLTLSTTTQFRPRMNKLHNKAKLLNVCVPQKCSATCKPILHNSYIIRRASNHHDLFLTTKQETKLINKGLNYVFQMRSHCFKLAQISKFVLKQGRPPTYCQVFTVHTIFFATFSNPKIATIKQKD